MAAALHDSTPLTGSLVPLRTKDEVRAGMETLVAYVVEIPARHANTVKDVLQEAIPTFKTSEISHLRRVVQYKYLPPHLQTKFYPPARIPRGEEDDAAPRSPASIPLPPSPPSSHAGVVTEQDAVRFFLLCPTRHMQPAELLKLLRNSPPFDSLSVSPKLLYATVPALAPTSSEQAAQWSEQYWPIAYKNTNPYGPHPSLVARNAAEIEHEAGGWLTLARTAGQQISESQLGENIGCVVVDRARETPQVITVAGDCRWRSPLGASESRCGPGNVMAHAVQRVIAMVAKKRLKKAGADPALLDRTLFCDIPLTPIEKKYYDTDNIPASGYLCVDLDIYLTHEPCVMCSMAILHSRFRRCIFESRMPATGGMTADGPPQIGLKHGIFWRPSELNWKFLTWEFKGNERTSIQLKDTLHV